MNEMYDNKEKEFDKSIEDKIKKEESKSEYPKVVKDAFLEDDGLIAKIKNFFKMTTTKDKEGNRITIKKTLQEPLLLLMKNSGYMETLEGIRAGEFIMSSKNGEKSVMLTPEKLTTWKYGGQYYKTWVAHEDNMMPYPQNPLHDAEMFRKVTTKLSMNWRDRDEAKLFEGKGKMWLLILAGVAILIVLVASSQGAKELLFGAQPAIEQAAQQGLETVKQNLTGTVKVG